MNNIKSKKDVIQPITFDDKHIPVGRFDKRIVKYQPSKDNEMKNMFANLLDSSNDALRLKNPETVQNIVAYNPPQNVQVYQPIPFEAQIVRAVSMSDETRHAYEEALGRANAKLVEALNKDKLKEKTKVSHQLTDVGFLRGKAYVDGTVDYNLIAESRILAGKKWNLANEELFILKIQNVRTGVVQVTDAMAVQDLECEKAVRVFLSRYFFPNDCRAYSKDTIFDFRSRIYEFLNYLECEKLDLSMGWKKTSYFKYADGSMCPLKNSVAACLRKVQKKYSLDTDKLLSQLCEELENMDFDNRVRFLMGYGLIACFSSICINNWENSWGLLITGEQTIVRSYADHCLKFYQRESGSDIINIQDISEKELSEYIGVLRNDVMILDGNQMSRKKDILKAIVSGRTIHNHAVKTPIVVLQKNSLSDIEYTDFIVLDLYGFQRSEKLFKCVNDLKAVLLNAVESEKCIVWENICRYAENYVDVLDAVLEFVELVLIQAGASYVLAKHFVSELKKGKSILYNQTKRSREIPNVFFCQRLRTLVYLKELRVLRFNKDWQVQNEENAIWLKDENAIIPTKYLRRTILERADISFGEFRGIRDNLIANGILDTYDTEKELTKDVTLPSGKRISAYVFERNYLFDEELVEEGRLCY